MDMAEDSQESVMCSRIPDDSGRTTSIVNDKDTPSPSITSINITLLEEQRKLRKQLKMTVENGHSAIMSDLEVLSNIYGKEDIVKELREIYDDSFSHLECERDKDMMVARLEGGDIDGLNSLYDKGRIDLINVMKDKLDETKLILSKCLSNSGDDVGVSCEKSVVAGKGPSHTLPMWSPFQPHYPQAHFAHWENGIVSKRYFLIQSPGGDGCPPEQFSPDQTSIEKEPTFYPPPTNFSTAVQTSIQHEPTFYPPPSNISTSVQTMQHEPTFYPPPVNLSNNHAQIPTHNSKKKHTEKKSFKKGPSYDMLANKQGYFADTPAMDCAFSCTCLQISHKTTCRWHSGLKWILREFFLENLDSVDNLTLYSDKIVQLASQCDMTVKQVKAWLAFSRRQYLSYQQLKKTKSGAWQAMDIGNEQTQESKDGKCIKVETDCTSSKAQVDVQPASTMQHEEQMCGGVNAVPDDMCALRSWYSGGDDSQVAPQSTEHPKDSRKAGSTQQQRHLGTEEKLTQVGTEAIKATETNQEMKEKSGRNDKTETICSEMLQKKPSEMETNELKQTEMSREINSEDNINKESQNGDSNLQGIITSERENIFIQLVMLSNESETHFARINANSAPERSTSDDTNKEPEISVQLSSDIDVNHTKSSFNDHLGSQEQVAKTDHKMITDDVDSDSYKPERDSVLQSGHTANAQTHTSGRIPFENLSQNETETVQSVEKKKNLKRKSSTSENVVSHSKNTDTVQDEKHFKRKKTDSESVKMEVSGNEDDSSCTCALHVWYRKHKDCPYPTKADLKRLAKIAACNEEELLTWFEKQRLTDGLCRILSKTREPKSGSLSQKTKA